MPHVLVQTVDSSTVRYEKPDDVDVADVARPVYGPPLLLVVHVTVRTVLK